MKYLVSILFAITTIALLVLAFELDDNVLDITVHDIYLVIEYAGFAILCAILAGVMSVIYWVLGYINKPIKHLVGVLNFIAYLLSLIIFTYVLLSVNSNNVEISVKIASLGFLVLILSITLFFYGIIMAFYNPK